MGVTDLYCRSTDTHQYLQKGSCHPWHVKKAIPYGQALRIRRICSDEKKLRMRSEELVGWLVDRGYKEDFVREQIGKQAIWTEQHSLIRKVVTVVRKRTIFR